MEKNKRNRRLKVHSKHINNSRNYYYSKYTAVPYIHLSGMWLENANFKIGDYIDVQVADECLIIRKITEL